MDTRLLVFFLGIAEVGNMTRAAENLHVTQPTLYKQLNKLEKMLGVELFQWTSCRIILIGAGLTLQDRARVILELTEKTFTDLQHNHQEVHGTLKMSVAENESFREIVKTFKIINEEHPKIQFDVHSGDAMDVIDRLDQGTIDVELLVGTPSLKKYNTLKLLMDELPPLSSG